MPQLAICDLQNSGQRGYKNLNIINTRLFNDISYQIIMTSQHHMYFTFNQIISNIAIVNYNISFLIIILFW